MTQEFINSVIGLSGLTTKQAAYKMMISAQTLNKWRKGESEPLFVNQKIFRSVFKQEIQQIKKFNK